MAYISSFIQIASLMIELLFLMPELKIISYSEFLSRYFF